MHVIGSLILAFALAFNIAPPDEAAKWKELEALLDRAAAADTFSGAVLVARNGTPVFKKAYGMANQEKRAAREAALGTPATTNGDGAGTVATGD